MNLSLEKILEGINEKRCLAYKYMYDNYYASLCSYARQFLGDGMEEEDVVQDVFMRLWEREGEFSSMDGLMAFLYRAVHNGCLRKIRDKRELLGKNLEIAEAVLAYESEENERLLIEEEYYRQIYVLIDGLSDQRRTIMLLSLQGKKVEEIAAELDISVNTVKTLKKRSYAYLRDQLSGEAWAFFCLLHFF